MSVQRPVSPLSKNTLPGVGSAGIPTWLFDFLVAVKKRLESVLIRANKPPLPTGQTLIGHTVLSANADLPVPSVLGTEFIGTGVNIHNDPQHTTFLLLTNGSPSGSTLALATRANVESFLAAARTGTGTFLPFTLYASGVEALQVHSTLTAASSSTVSPVFIRFADQLVQIKFFDDGTGKRVLYV